MKDDQSDTQVLEWEVNPNQGIMPLADTLVPLIETLVDCRGALYDEDLARVGTALLVEGVRGALWRNGLHESCAHVRHAHRSAIGDVVELDVHLTGSGVYAETDPCVLADGIARARDRWRRLQRLMLEDGDTKPIHQRAATILASHDVRCADFQYAVAGPATHLYPLSLAVEQAVDGLLDNGTSSVTLEEFREPMLADVPDFSPHLLTRLEDLVRDSEELASDHGRAGFPSAPQPGPELDALRASLADYVNAHIDLTRAAWIRTGRGLTVHSDGTHELSTLPAKDGQ